MVIILLCLWRQEGRRRTASEIAYISASLAEQFQKTEGDGVLSDRRQKQRWRRLQANTLKLNTDGSFDNESKKGRWGFSRV